MSPEQWAQFAQTKREIRPAAGREGCIVCGKPLVGKQRLWFEFADGSVFMLMAHPRRCRNRALEWGEALIRDFGFRWPFEDEA